MLLTYLTALLASSAISHASLPPAYQQRPAVFEDQALHALAPNFILYHFAAVEFAVAQGTAFSGTIADNQLALPFGYRKAAPWSSEVINHVVITHPTGDLPLTFGGQFAAAVASSAQGDFGAGIVAGGRFQSANDGNSTLSITVPLPDGTPVYVTSLQ